MVKRQGEQHVRGLHLPSCWLLAGQLGQLLVHVRASGTGLEPSTAGQLAGHPAGGLADAVVRVLAVQGHEVRLLGRVGAGPGGQLQAAQALGQTVLALAAKLANLSHHGRQVLCTVGQRRQVGLRRAPDTLQAHGQLLAQDGGHVQVLTPGGAVLQFGERRRGQDGLADPGAGGPEVDQQAGRPQRGAAEALAEPGPDARVVGHAQDVAADHR